MLKLKSVETLRERERELQFSKINKGGNTFINHIKNKEAHKYTI